MIFSQDILVSVPTEEERMVYSNPLQLHACNACFGPGQKKLILLIFFIFFPSSLY